MYYSELMQRMEFCRAEGYYSLGFAEKSRLIMQFANEKRVMQKEKNKRRYSAMKCVVCGNSHLSKFLEEDRQDSIILTCAECGSIVESFRTATIEEKQLLSGSE